MFPPDPSPPPDPSAEDLHQAALESLECQGRLREDLEKVINFWAKRDGKADRTCLIEMAGEGCEGGPHIAAGYWFSLTDAERAAVPREATDAFLRLDVSWRTSREAGPLLLHRDVLVGVGNSLVVGGDGEVNRFQRPLM